MTVRAIPQQFKDRLCGLEPPAGASVRDPAVTGFMPLHEFWLRLAGCPMRWDDGTAPNPWSFMTADRCTKWAVSKVRRLWPRDLSQLVLAEKGDCKIQESTRGFLHHRLDASPLRSACHAAMALPPRSVASTLGWSPTRARWCHPTPPTDPPDFRRFAPP